MTIRGEAVMLHPLLPNDDKIIKERSIKIKYRTVIHLARYGEIKVVVQIIAML